MNPRCAFLLAGLLVACGGSTPPPDVDAAPPLPDAPPPPAAENVACPAVVDVEVVTAGQSYQPMVANVPRGGVVRFTMTSDHSARSLTNLFDVPFGATACARFNAPGTYQYYCVAHGFTGSVVVP